jgi:hypothetical protein
MAAPGTLTHVLEVAAQLAAVTGTHAATLLETAAAVTTADTVPPATAAR